MQPIKLKITLGALALSGCLILANCSNDNPTQANFGVSSGQDAATFEIGCDTTNTTTTTGTTGATDTTTPTTSASASPAAGVSTQDVALTFDSACSAQPTTSPTATVSPLASASPTTSPSPLVSASPAATTDASGAQTYQFAGDKIGPVRVTPNCANRTVTIDMPNAQTGTTSSSSANTSQTVQLNSDNTFNATVRVNAMLERDSVGNTNCMATLNANLQGTVSCTDTVNNTTGTTGTTAGSPSVTLNGNWQFETSDIQPTGGATPVATATPLASPSASPSATVSPLASPSASPTATASPLASPSASPTVAASPLASPAAQQCVITNDCGFTTSNVQLSCPR